MSVQQLARQANQRDKKTAKEEHTLKKNHKPGVTNKATPSKIDSNFKNTRAEVGPSTGKTIAPQHKSSSYSAAKPAPKPAPKKSFFGKSSSSAKPAAASSSSSSQKRFCAACGTPRGNGSFCSSCGNKI